jgi:hypothetical protein
VRDGVCVVSCLSVCACVSAGSCVCVLAVLCVSAARSSFCVSSPRSFFLLFCVQMMVCIYSAVWELGFVGEVQKLSDLGRKERGRVCWIWDLDADETCACDRLWVLNLDRFLVMNES